MTRSRILLAAMAMLGLTDSSFTQVVAPPPPKVYDAQVRYRIRGGRNDRIVQYFHMIQYLERAGFRKDPGPGNEPEDSTLVRMTGTIDAKDVRKLLDEPHVKQLVLFPAGFKLPADERPVKVQLELVAGLPLEQQRQLHEQVNAVLRDLGFQEMTGYDHRRFSRVVGQIPADEVPTLFFDLRAQPTGWLMPENPLVELPLPLREYSPVRITELIPEPEGVAPAKEPAAAAAEPAQENLRKITPDLRAFIAKEGETGRPTRVEAILVATPGEDSLAWRRDLIEAAPQAVIEGRLGQIVTCLAPVEKVAALANSPIVSTLRLPSSGAPQILPATDSKGMNEYALQSTGLARLHGLGHKGKGIRIGVIGGDFRGWEALVGKKLPARTRLVDLTIERNYQIEPEPYPLDKEPLGSGTRAALAVALAAPQADLVLIRIDPSSPYQLLQVAKRINGDDGRSLTRIYRAEEFDLDRERLRVLWDKLLFERRVVFGDFGADEEAVKKREEHFKKVKEQKEDEYQFQQRVDRFLQLERDLREFPKLNVVVNTLVWEQGHQVDGGSPISRYLDDKPFRDTIWFQAAGDTRGQSWVGSFRDADRNGVMDFSPDHVPPRPGRWINELNFLAWQPHAGKLTPEIPEKITVRIGIQWKEAHDPEFLRRGEDLYRTPLFQPRLVLLRQRDPSGAKLPTDDLEIIARSGGLPQRIANDPDSATYEQSLELTLDAAGYYALRVEGRLPKEIRPASAPSLPPVQRSFEVRPRIFLQVTEAAARGVGRVVFLDYPTDEGTIGMPGDAQGVVTMGAADRWLRPQPYSARGPAMGLELMLKPNIFSFDALEVGVDPAAVQGTYMSAAFAAGQTAAMLGAGLPPRAFWLSLPPRPESVLKVPDGLPVKR